MSELSPEEYAFVARSLSAALGNAVRITGTRPAHGGSIHHAVILDTTQGPAFAKIGEARCLDLFSAEADGLHALRGASRFKVPDVLAVNADVHHSCLILEYLDIRPVTEDGAGRRVGEALAELHANTSDSFGWHRNNYLGSTPLCNQSTNMWPRFLAQTRFAPLIDMAVDKGHHETLRPGKKLIDRLPALFAEDKFPPSLTHGDLWHGNVGISPDGIPTLFDPAILYGDPEADLAMASLFGGFPEGFYLTYRAARPLRKNHMMRERLYRCIHLLNHLVLFGTGYKRETLRQLDWLNRWT